MLTAFLGSRMLSPGEFDPQRAEPGSAQAGDGFAQQLPARSSGRATAGVLACPYLAVA